MPGPVRGLVPRAWSGVGRMPEREARLKVEVVLERVAALVPARSTRRGRGRSLRPGTGTPTVVGPRSTPLRGQTDAKLTQCTFTSGPHVAGGDLKFDDGRLAWAASSESRQRLRARAASRISSRVSFPSPLRSNSRNPNRRNASGGSAESTTPSRFRSNRSKN